MEAVATAKKRDKAAALKLLKRIMKTYGAPRSIVTDGLPGIFGGDERDRCCCRAARGRRVGSTIALRIRINRFGDANGRCSGFEVRRRCRSSSSSSCPGAQPLQSGAPSRHEASLQAETLCCLGRVARSQRHRSPLARWRSRCMSMSLRYFDSARRADPSWCDNAPRPVNLDALPWRTGGASFLFSPRNGRPCGAHVRTGARLRAQAAAKTRTHGGGEHDDYKKSSLVYGALRPGAHRGRSPARSSDGSSPPLRPLIGSSSSVGVSSSSSRWRSRRSSSARSFPAFRTSRKPEASAGLG